MVTETPRSIVMGTKSLPDGTTQVLIGPAGSMLPNREALLGGDPWKVVSSAAIVGTFSKR